MASRRTDRFEATPYQAASSAGGLAQVRAELASRVDEHSDVMVAVEREGVLRYLGEDTVHHSEGRDASYEKTSFSVSELKQAHARESVESVRYLRYRFRFNDYPRKHHLRPVPIVLCIEPTSICNLRCTMCFQSDHRLAENPSLQGRMDWELYEQLVDQAVDGGVDSFVFASRGEPLLHPQVYSMIRHAKDRGVLDVKLNTNATALNDKNCVKLLESGLDTLVFSVDSADPTQFEEIRRGARFDQVAGNIRRFREIRSRSYSTVRLRTRVSLVQVSTEIDVEKARTFWGGLVDEFGERWVIDRTGIYENAPLDEVRPCSLLWERLYVWFDGTVAVCDEDYLSRLSPGRFPDRTLSQIWHGDQMTKLRIHHARGDRVSCGSPCDRCPGF